MKNKGAILGCFIAAALSSLFLMGMGGMSQGSATNNQLSFDAKLTDTENNSVQLTSVVIDGKTSFQGFMGKGKIVVPFDQIIRIEIKGKTACITMRNSHRLCNIRIKDMSRLEGNASYGTYQIPLSDVIGIDLSRAKQ